MNPIALIVVVVVLLLIFAHPGIGFGQRLYPAYGYPAYGGGIVAILVVLMVLWLLGVLR